MKVKNAALTGVLVFGIVSLLGDIIYEGSRGVISPFLYNLGASAAVVGLVLGAGEFVGYALRGIFGALSDRTGSYWGMTIGGYFLLISIPLLAVAGRWETALVLILFERLSKAVRTPARDTLLSHVTRKIGRGKAFGLHELLDQIGAVAGPAIVSVALFFSGKFEISFAILAVPYALMMAALLMARRKLGAAAEIKKSDKRWGSAGSGLIRYSAAVALNCAGLVPAGLILYRATDLGVLTWVIPLLYLGIQAVDAISAVAAGYAYDSTGRKILFLPFAASLIPSVLVFGGIECVLASAIIFGIIYGMQESVYRAAVADMTPISSRGTAYGIFHTFYGFGFLIGGAVFGMFLEGSMWTAAVLYSICMQAVAMVLLGQSLRD
ncbi:MAG: MFS transporter [Candidatus Hadarchaeales archaeon]